MDTEVDTSNANRERDLSQVARQPRTKYSPEKRMQSSETREREKVGNPAAWRTEGTIKSKK